MANTTTKDTIINFKNTRLGKNSKGGDRFELSMAQDQVAALIETLTTLQGNERGVTLDIHVTEKTTNDGSRTFLSGFSFVKAIQEFGSSRRGSGTNAKFVPKAAANTKLNDKIRKELA